MFERGLCATVPRSGRSRCTQWASNQSSLATDSSLCACRRVDGVLADVDVHADAEVGGQARDGLERRVRERETGVGADKARGHQSARSARSRPVRRSAPSGPLRSVTS